MRLADRVISLFKRESEVQRHIEHLEAERREKEIARRVELVKKEAQTYLRPTTD